MGSPLLRLMPRLTQRLTPGCTTTGLVMLLVLMDTDIMVITWVIMGMVIIWVTLAIMVTPTTMDIMERGTPRLNQLPRLMPKLPQRLTPGCTTAMLVTDSTHTVMVIMAMVWAMLPMLDITPTLTSEAAE